MNSIRCAVSVPADRHAAFERFVSLSWWVPEYTWSGDVLREIAIESRAEGMCFEVGPHGFRCDWGPVLDWSPPERLRCTWQIGPGREPVPDPARASGLELTFLRRPDGGTDVAIEHSGFERHGAGGAGYRDALASDAGSPLLLDAYARTFGRG